MKPLATDTERILLGELQYDAKDIARSMAAGLRAEHFAFEKHRLIFGAMSKLHAEAQPVDHVTLFQALGGQVTFDDVCAVLNCEATTDHCQFATQVVMREGIRRQAVAQLSRAQAKITESTAGTWSEIWADANEELRKLNEVAAGVSGVKTWADGIEGAKKIFFPEKNFGVTGPFPAWDRLAGKLLPGQLCVLAAESGVGKSALACQYALAVARSGKVAQVFSLEMTLSEMQHRMAVQTCRSTDPAEGIAALESLPEHLLKVDDLDVVRRWPDIEARAALAASSGNLGIIIIDYIQIVRPADGEKAHSREREVAQLAESSKRLAGTLGVPVIILAQFNRGPALDQREPQAHDLRESAALQHCADALWLLWRKIPSANEPPPPPDARTFPCVMKQVKRRGGRNNVAIALGFTGEIVSFAPLHETQTQTHHGRDD